MRDIFGTQLEFKNRENYQACVCAIFSSVYASLEMNDVNVIFSCI